MSRVKKTDFVKASTVYVLAYGSNKQSVTFPSMGSLQSYLRDFKREFPSVDLSNINVFMVDQYSLKPDVKSAIVESLNVE